MKITIDTEKHSREQLEELKEYLNENCWNFEEENDITYEIIGYMTASDFEGRNGTDCGDGYPTMDEAFKVAKELQDEYVVVKVQSSDREEIKILGEVPEEEKEVLYVLGEDSINDIKLNEKICGEELHEYSIIERTEFIDTLIGWIGECGHSDERSSDKYMMKQDLEMLMEKEDTYMFTSNSTNSYIFEGDSEFNETCEELIEINKTLFEKVEE